MSRHDPKPFNPTLLNNKAVPAWLWNTPDLTRRQKEMLACLYVLNGRVGNKSIKGLPCIFHGNRTIAEVYGSKLREARSRIRELRDAGYILEFPCHKLCGPNKREVFTSTFRVLRHRTVKSKGGVRLRDVEKLLSKRRSPVVRVEELAGRKPAIPPRQKPAIPPGKNPPHSTTLSCCSTTSEGTRLAPPKAFQLGVATATAQQV